MNDSVHAAGAATEMNRTIGDKPLWPVGLGGANWSVLDSHDDAGAIRTIHAGLDAGIRLIDTSYAYTTTETDNHNEALVRRALAERNDRDEAFVVTKGGHFRISATKWGIDNRPETLRKHCEESLRALGVARVGLYLIHWTTPEVPIAESVGALKSLQDEGKIGQIGLSNVADEELEQALQVAEISAVENHFSPLDQTDRLMVERCAKAGIAYLAYSPLGGAGRKKQLHEILPTTASIAREAHASIQRVLLAWHLHTSATLIPIAGASRPETATDSAGAPCLDLPEGVWAHIDRELGRATK
jgi:aryl-alcohol dehydrogenase-like predicted oxidoreductase